MRRQVKVTSGCPIDPISRHHLLLTGEIGILYGCTFISDSYRGDLEMDAQWLKLASEVIEEENGRS